MLVLISFINLFMVPVISIGILYRNKREDLKPSFDLFIKYSILTSLNIPITRIFTYVGKVLTDVNIEADSIYYTVCAVFAAMVMAFSWESYLANRDKKIHEQENSIDINEKNIKA